MMHAAVESTYAMSAPALIVGDDGPESMDAAEAVSLVGARALGRVDWRHAIKRLENQAALGLIMIEADRIDDAVIETVLPRINALARAAQARVVIALGERQIDLVSTILQDSHAELLCAPSIAERAAALAVAMAPGTHDRLHDVTRDAESTRLRRLNEEVARIAEILARLTRAEGREASTGSEGLTDDLITYGTSAIDASPVSARDVRDAIRARRLRDQYFERGLFEDPAWDMLLDLFAAELEQTQVSVSSLCIAAGVAPTTALRWIARMTDAGLFERQPDPFDRRRAFMALSPGARGGMMGYFTAVKRAGLPAA